MTPAAFVDSVKSPETLCSGSSHGYVDRIPQSSPTDGPRFTQDVRLGRDWPSMQFKLKPGSLVIADGQFPFSVSTFFEDTRQDLRFASG